jgi:hypothetical protein
MLATLADVARFRPNAVVGGNEVDALAALRDADEWVKGQLRRALEYGTFADRPEADGSGLLTLQNWPVATVLNLTVYGVRWEVLRWDDEQDLNQPAYLPKHGMWLESRFCLQWPTQPGSVFVRYEGGYNPIPRDLVELTVEVAHLFIIERSRLGDNQKSFGSEQMNEYLRDPKKYPLLANTLAKYSHFGFVP